jgi:hypothetical protein
MPLELHSTTTLRPDPYRNQHPGRWTDTSPWNSINPATRPSVLISICCTTWKAIRSPSPRTRATAHGTAALQRTNLPTRPQPAGYVGRDEFTFTLGDGRQQFVTATMESR